MTPLTNAARRGSRVLLAVAALSAQACSLVRPVSLTPPLPVEPPPTYVFETHESIDGKAPATGDSGTKAPPLEASTKAAPVDGRWWTAFGDPALDALIQEAMLHNFTLRDLRGLYHEDLLVPQMPNGPLWPLQIGAPVAVQRTRVGVPAAAGVSAYPLATNEADVGLTATYQLDVWGQLDLQRKGFLDLAEQQAMSGEASAQNTAAQIAQVWFEILTQRALLELLQSQIKLNEDLLALVKARFELHVTARLAVLQQEQLLLNTRAQQPLIAARLALLGSQLTSLLGRPPSPNTDLVPPDRKLPELPTQVVAQGIPADLVRSSPEVRLAQIRVAEAEHQVSLNLTGWLPQVSVFLNGGLQAFDLHQPVNFNWSNGGGNSFETWSFGARLTWPIFDGGQRITEARALTLTVKRRNMLYQEAFLEAVRRVQDAQIQETKQAANVQTLRAEVALGKQVLAEATQLYEQGSSDYLSVLAANANLSELQHASILAERILLSYRIDLYRALGGTWSRSVVEIND